MVKNSSAMQETWVGSLGLEDPLEEEMATHFSILAWRIPWTDKPGGLQSMGLQGSDWASYSPALAGRFFTASATWEACYYLWDRESRSVVSDSLRPHGL